MKHDQNGIGPTERSTTSTDDNTRVSQPPPDVAVYDRPEERRAGLSSTAWLAVVLVIALVAVGAFLLLQPVF
jgi:hypothetical protein